GLQRRVAQYRGDSRFSTRLFSVTRRTALNHDRTETRRARIREVREVEVAPGPASPDATLDEQTVAALVLRYFESLPPKQRLIFELVDLRGESPADVARTLGMQPVTVRTHLFKARRTIRARLLELHEPLMKEFLS